jgi:hypothetical protein
MLTCCFFNLAANVGSYTQGRTAGEFLSSRKAARTERYPQKTTAAALAGLLMLMAVILCQMLFYHINLCNHTSIIRRYLQYFLTLNIFQPKV